MVSEIATFRAQSGIKSPANAFALKEKTVLHKGSMLLNNSISSSTAVFEEIEKV
jgi:hypothetical protein